VVFLAENRLDLANSPPRVAFALGRKVGSAVERNRLRRRLRSIMAGLAGGPSGPLRSGAYLIGARPGVNSLSYQELELHVERVLRRIDERMDRA
jgi:ribonuclease P protein component